MTDLTREQISELLSSGSANFVGNDLARQLLTTMTERDEAKAAQAATVERCAEVARKHAKHLQKNGLIAMSSDFDHIETDIRSLADPTGVKLLAELRQREANLALHAANLADQLAEAQKLKPNT